MVLNARQDSEEANIILSAGQPGRITVATNMAGRGTDIQLSGGVVSAGGLHVILTEYHESSRIDRQLFGRGARQGDPGSYECIVSLTDELFERFGWHWLARIMQAAQNSEADPNCRSDSERRQTKSDEPPKMYPASNNGILGSNSISHAL